MSLFTHKSTTICIGILGVGIAAMLLTSCCQQNISESILYKPAQYSDNPTIYPQNTYTVIALAVENIVSLNKAADIAVKYCDKSHLDAKVLSRETNYQGLTHTEKNIAEKANLLFNRKEALSTTTQRDYRTTLKFICVDPSKKAL